MRDFVPITERLLEFSRTGEPRRDPTDLRGLVQAVQAPQRAGRELEKQSAIAVVFN